MWWWCGDNQGEETNTGIGSSEAVRDNFGQRRNLSYSAADVRIVMLYALCCMMYEYYAMLPNLSPIKCTAILVPLLTEQQNF